MHLELILKPETPIDLYNSLKQYAPTPGGVFRPSKVEELQGMLPKGMTREQARPCVCCLTLAGRKALLANPRFNWYKAFTWV